MSTATSTTLLSRTDAIIVVDMQNDFCAGGPLAVQGADQIVQVINRWIERAQEAGATIVLSRDWHPPDHCSFKSEGGPWPVHCVRDTPGAEFHPRLRVPQGAMVVEKATDPQIECYSDFAGTGLARRLRQAGVTRLWVGGLATDYCVRATVLDALADGFEVHVIKAAVRAVNVNPGDGQRAIDEMRQAGAVMEDDENGGDGG